MPRLVCVLSCYGQHISGESALSSRTWTRASFLQLSFMAADHEGKKPLLASEEEDSQDLSTVHAITAAKTTAAVSENQASAEMATENTQGNS